MFLGERARFGAEEPPTRGLLGDRTPQARLLQESLMSRPVVVGGLLEPVAPGEAKHLPTLRQSVSEVVISSVGAKPWPPPGAARNAMTLLPGEKNTEQIRTRGNHHAKPSASAAVLGVTAAAAAADASLLRGEADSAICKEAAVPRVGDAANNGSSTALQCQGSQKEVPTFCVSRAAMDTHHGGASCCEESKGDTERGEGSAPPPLGDSNCRVAVHGSFSQSFEKAVCTEDEHEGRPPTVEPNPEAPINSSAKYCTASEREEQAVDAGEGVGTDVGEDDLEQSVSRRNEEPPRLRPHHVAEEISGSAEILETGACIDGETATADKITAPASPSIAEIDAVEARARLQPSNDAGGSSGSIIGGGVLEAEIVSTEDDNVADTEGNRTEEAHVMMAPLQEQSHPPAVEAGDVDGGTKADSTQGEVLFLPSESFDGAKHGYVFRLGDKGLGFYVEGYVDRRTKAKHAHVRRPWNAGPGDEVIRRGPIGPVHKPFKIIKTRPREGKSAADEPDMRPLTARLAAQRDAQAFQSTLSDREHAVDTHTLALLEKLSDPAFLKGNNSCIGHGQTLGKDGKTVVQAKPEKGEDDRAKLLWYRKVYEDHLRSQFLSKRSGDSTEKRRVAHAASRHFAAELSEREDELDSSLVQALKDQTKLEFLKAEYRNPGAYDDDGRLIPEEDGSVSNELHRTDEQKERTRTYGFKARQRFHVAHDDLVGAISKKDEDLQNALKNTDPATLQDIEEQVVSTSGGVGVYRQKRRVGRENSPGRQSSSTARRKKSPEQLRGKFAQSFEAQVRGKDNALMEKVAGLDEEETKQIVDDLGKDVKCLPDSWRKNLDSLRKIQKHRKQLVAEIAADRRKVVCPWRPGGKHIAHKPWQAFAPRDHRPPVRSASEKKAGPLNEDTGNPKAQEDGGQWPDSRPGGGGGGGGGRPHTAPSRRRTPFIDIVGPSAKRVLAAQPPDASLHNAFSTYSNEPFPRFEPALRPAWQSGQAPRNLGACTDTGTPLRRRPGGTDHGRQRRVWSARVDPPTSGRTVSSSNTKRPHSAAPKVQGRFCAPSQRPSTASGATSAVTGGMDGLDVRKPADIAPEQEQKRASQPLEECSSRSLEECSSQSLDLNVRSGPGVTVLWARLCQPSSDLAYKGSAWPARPRRPGPSHHLSRRRDEPSRKVPTDKPSRKVAADNLSRNMAKDNPSRQVAAKTAGDVTETATERDGVRGMAGAVCSTPVDAECKGGGGVRRLSGRGEGEAVPLGELEDRLRARSWKRIHQRHSVFRGYAERSRRSRVWDPESPVYADGVGEDHPARLRSRNAASPRSCDSASRRSCNAGWNEGKERGGTFTMASPGEVDSTRDRKRKTRNRWRGVAADADRPVEMDWKEVTGRFRGFQVGTRRFREVADKIEASLEGKLFAAVTGNLTGEHLRHCFREAQGLVASAGALLGCSKDERKRFTKEDGEDLQRRHYAATVTRLSILWAAICGVVEIVGMLERRKELLKVFRLGGHRLAPKNKQGAPAPGGDNAAAGREEECPVTATSMTAVSPVEPIRTRQYWKRLELAENSAAIAESLKIWLGIVPWPVEVLYGGEKLVWSLAAEEKALPWPPDPESFADTEDVRVEAVPRGGECQEG